MRADANRWWIYQRERFPLVGHGALIAAFSLSAISYSAMLRGSDGLPHWRSGVVAFVTCFLFFLQLRIADEFKDFEEDARWRPYRPVPRGLVTLRELGFIFVGAAALQFALALWLEPWLVVWLLITWTYLALMSREFYVRDWLKHHLIIYATSHMIIMPLVDLYATSTDWVMHQSWPPSGIYWFLLASYFNGLVIEVGRKIRVPADEEDGVETYSALWGRRRALLTWHLLLALTAVFALMAARHSGHLSIMAAIVAMSIIAAVAVAASVARAAAPGAGKRVEQFSGLWTLLLYLGLGIIPILWQHYA